MKTGLLALSLWVVGCNNGAISVTSGTVPTLDAYLQRSVQIGCSFLGRCGFYSKSQLSECQSWLSALDSAALKPASAAIAAGQLGYNASAAADCLNALSTATCDLNVLLMADASPACKSILQPQVAVGGTCVIDAECVNGFCNLGPSGTSCSGSCAAFAARGAPCDGVQTRCDATDYCSSNSLCVALVAQGQSCDPSTISCAAGLNCMTEGATSTCAPPGAEGQACAGDFTAACAGGLYCNSSASSPICQKTQGAGGACNPDGTGCDPDLACVIDDPNGSFTVPGTCRAFVDVGQSCSGTTSHTACASDAACDPTTHTCQLIGQAGDDCTTGSCAMQFYCNAANQCAARIAPGQACTPATTGDDPCLGGTCDPTSLTCGAACSS